MYQQVLKLFYAVIPEDSGECEIKAARVIICNKPANAKIGRVADG